MVWAILNNTVMTGVDEFIDHQSERVVAILGGGVAEEALLRSMEVRFRKSRVTAEIFKDRGALGGFRSKIEVGYLLCAYEKPVRLALMGISEIRNFFAHNLEIKEFTGPNSKLDESFAKLSLHTIYSTYPSPFWDGPSEFDVESVSDRRSQFIINLKLVLIFLMRDMKRHEIYSNEPKALPPPPPRGTPLPEFEP